MRVFFIFLCLVFFPSCTPRVIQAPASNLADVRSVHVVPALRVTNCEFVGMVSSTEGGNFKDYQRNIEIATNEIRSEASLRGGTHLVLDPPQREDRSYNPWMPRGGQCNNCVTVSGTVYKCVLTPEEKEEEPEWNSVPPEIHELGDLPKGYLCNSSNECASGICSGKRCQ